MTASGVKYSAEDLAALVQLAGAGQFRAVSERSYDLSDIFEAHGFVDTGRKRGSVVVRTREVTPRGESRWQG